MAEIPSLILELVNAGIPVTLGIDEEYGGLCYQLSGFYKSNGVKILQKDGEYLLVDRYNSHTIHNSGDVVYHHASWWERSRDRADVWEQPEEAWLPLLLEHRYIEQIPPDTRVRYQPRKVR